jgi:adenylate cyclase
MRVVRTFGFLDVSGFTRFGDIQGDEEAVGVLRGFRTAVRDSASDFGVRVAKWLGDGAMFVGVDGQNLVDAILNVRRTLEHEGQVLPVHGGIARGHVIVFEGDDYIGSAINIAARLCDQADAQEILITAADADIVPGWADMQDAGERLLPGLTHPVAALRLIDPARSPIRPQY